MALPLWFWMAFWIIIWIIIMVILITFVILIMVKTKKFPDIKRDIKVEALFNQFSNGHSEGWLKSVKPVNNRKLITFIPIDLTDEEIENAQETIAVTDSQIHITPKGRYSNAYGKMYILPKEISEIINKLPKSLGDGFLKTSITEQLKADFLETIKQGTEARSFILKQLADGELSREALIKLEEKWEKFATSKLEELPKEAQQK